MKGICLAPSGVFLPHKQAHSASDKLSFVNFSILLSFLLLLAACTQNNAADSAGQTTNNITEFVNTAMHEVSISGFFFVPKNVTIYQGDRVKWNNRMPMIKSVWLWGEEPSPIIKPGRSWSFIFTEPGFYKYRDKLSQDMEGNITVLPYKNRDNVTAGLT